MFSAIDVKWVYAYLYKHGEEADDYVHVFAMQILALPMQSKW